MAASLGGIDALVFTGGVGEHASEVRAAACADFAWIGLSLDEGANASLMPDAEVAMPASRVRILVVHAREELLVARETLDVLRASE
jgi:acetate kinase